MSDYYIPLSAIVGSLNLNNIPVIGDDLAEAFAQAAQVVGVRRWQESWNERDATVRGTGVWKSGGLSKNFGKFELAFGDPAGDTTEFEFELSVDRASLLSTAIELGEELAGVGDVSTLDGKLSFLFRADGPPIDFRLILRGIAVRVRFDRSVVRKGQVVTGTDGNAIGIAPLPSPDPAHPVDDAADILIVPSVIILDSRRGFDLMLDDDQPIEMPPLLVVCNDQPFLGILVKKLKLDLSSTRSFSEALARGYDELWRGVYLEELAVFGLDAVFPTLPKKADPQIPGDGLVIDAKNWFLGSDGVSGSLKIAVASGPPANPSDPATRTSVFRGLSFELEMDRGNLIRTTGEVTLHVSSLGNELVSLGPDGDLAIGFNIRVNPDGGLLYEFILRTPRPDDPQQDLGLFTLKDDLADFFPFVLLVVGAAAGAPASAQVAVLLVQLFTVVRFFDFKAITLDNLHIRRRAELIDRHTEGGGIERLELRWFDFVLDLKLKLALDIPAGVVPLLPDIKTKPDHPMTVLCRGLTFSWATNHEDFFEEELGGRKAFELSLDPDNAVSFEVGDETIIEQSPLVLTKIGIGRWDQGLWFDIGFKVSKDLGDFAFSVVPSMMRFWFLANGDLDRVTFEAASFSLLVPRTLYARGEWQAGDISRASGRALILGWGSSLADYKNPANWLYNVGFAMREQDLPPPPEPARVTSRIVSFDLESSSGIPTVILPGTSLYGISGLHAEHAQPALGGDTPSQWLTQHPPQYRVDIDKWEAAEGHSGWAAGVILGASVDHGRPWNLKAAFVMLKPGPVMMLFGTANFLKQRKGVKETTAAALTFHATLDLVRNEFLLGVRYDKKVPEPTGRILKLSVPTELFLNEQGWHLYAGQDKPAAKHISAEFLSTYTISGYLMFDTAPIVNLGETGEDMPGFVAAAGIRFAYEGGRKGGRYKLYYYLRAAADLAVSLSDPKLTLVHAKVAGGLVAKAWGLGFEFELSAEFLWVRPTPDHLHGILKITIDLPWPIPNLHLSIDCSHGADGDGEPIVGSLIDGLSLYLRASQRSVEITSAAPATDVPLDPIFSLAFKYPTRNGAPVPGSFNISDGSASTCYYVGGDAANPRGYAISLDELTLWKETGATRVQVPGPFPALWRPDPLPAAGGKPATRVLELFAYDGIEASRFIGASADYVDWATDGFDRCPPSGPPQPVCYGFDAEPLGPIEDEHRVASGTAPVLRVASEGEALFAESVRRFYATVRTRAEVVPTPIQGLGQRLIRLPATNGVSPPVAAGDRLVLRFERAEQAQILVLRYPGGIVRMRAWLGDRLVGEDSQGVVHGRLGEDRFEVVEYILKGPLDRIEIEAAHGPSLRLRQSLVVRVCFLYSADVRAWNDLNIASLNWSTFWSDLLSQDAAASNALLLEPGTRYTLEVKSSWAHLREDGSLGSPHPATDTFSFTTVGADQAPAALRGPASGLDASDYEVRTVPADGERAVYTARPIRLEFRDARTDKLFGAFGKRLVLRLVDERGEDLFDRLDFLREHARDLPEYQRAWRDRVLGLPCALAGLEALWSKGVAHFDSVLATGRRYDGTLVLLPAAVTDLSTVENWDALPVVYRFRFETSRYPSLADHVAAYAIYDEVCERAPDLAALVAALGPLPPGGRRTDEQLLDRILFEHLNLLPRDPPVEPELVRIWRRSTTDPAQVALIGLLLDGPEPLVRAEGHQLALRDAASDAVPTVLVDQQGGARTLMLFGSGAGLGSLPLGAFSLTITSSFTGADGLPATETASLAFAVPAAPATLTVESPP